MLIAHDAIHAVKRIKGMQGGLTWSVWSTLLWSSAHRQDTAVVRMAAAVLPAFHTQLGRIMSRTTCTPCSLNLQKHITDPHHGTDGSIPPVNFPHTVNIIVNMLQHNISFINSVGQLYYFDKPDLYFSEGISHMRCQRNSVVFKTGLMDPVLV